MNTPSVIKRLFNPAAATAHRPLHCVFYSHIWSVYCLQAQGLLTAGTDVVVELATLSRLGLALDPRNRRPASLTALLAPDNHLRRLAARYPGMSAPVLLAPAQAVTVADAEAALALVATDLGPAKRAIVLVNLHDSAVFGGAYAHMDDFAILWDLADYPDARLPALARALADADCLDADHWRGVFLCNHPRRPVADRAGREQQLRQLLRKFDNLGPQR